MYKINYRIIKLIQHHFSGKLSSEENSELQTWLTNSPHHQEMFDAIYQGKELEKRELIWKQIKKEKALIQFEKKIGIQNKKIVCRVAKYAAILIFPILIIFLFGQKFNNEKKVIINESAIIQPGSMQATLILDNGKGISLDNLKKEELTIHQPGVQIQNTSKGLKYIDTTNKSSKKVFNHLKTPRGGEYNVTLSDGTKVYLNAASDLKYPIVFDNKSREVYLSGEAYFDVTKDTQRPFYVIVNAVKIEVYGTSFNINTHYDGRIQTVLVSGQIGIKGIQSELHKVMPSQLIEFTFDGKFLYQKSVDIAPYIAWREGQFIFENERLEQIMNTLSLWYDVDILYTNEYLKEHRFTGHMKKYEDINTILNAISKIMDVKFITKNKTITVTK